MGFMKPKSVPQPTAPTAAELQAESDAAAAEEAEKLRKGRVKTILTSGQGVEDSSSERKTVLGG